MVGGATVAILAHALGSPLGPAVAVGAVVGAVSFAVHFRHQLGRQNRSHSLDDAVFPSDDATG